ncbi:hypothetical protein HPULCUR_005988 [Helicostylum pulchrum]|uniref:UBA domain-containing protein n=1 Tax=Helicostylum pulchrum TaxID=562976 RepID=A0ABP9Y0M4_9FUNG
MLFHEGFRNAPVTKFLVPIVGGCSALALAFNAKPQMATQLSHLTSHGQFWRLFTSHWAFGSIGATVAGTWLIYKMKIVERRYGSSKYAALIFISFVASTLLQTGALVAGSQLGLIKSIVSGPCAILLSVIYQFQKIVPATYHVGMLGFNITDKTYVYIATVQLLLSSSSASIVPCLCGLIVGSVYDNTVIKSWRFPKWVRSFSSKYILPVLADKKRKRRRTTTTTTATTTRQQVNEVPVRRAPSPPINEQDIDTMFSMFPNYSRQDIKNALVRSKSDLNRAAEILLTTEPSAGSSGQT